MKFILKLSLSILFFMIAFGYTKGENETQTKETIVYYSITTHLSNEQNITKNQFKNQTNETIEEDFEFYFNSSLYQNFSNIAVIYNTTNDTIEEDFELAFNSSLYRNFSTIAVTYNTTNSSETLEDMIAVITTNLTNTTVSEIIQTNDILVSNESLATNYTYGSIIPAMPGIPIFREPPEIKIHDPDEGPLDPYYHPSNATDYYPSTIEPDQQFIFMKKPPFVAEKGSLEQKYKDLLTDENEDDITFPPGFNNNYTEIEKIIPTTTTTSTIKPENISTTEAYLKAQIPYPYLYNPFFNFYGYPAFVPNYNFNPNIGQQYFPPLYPGYYPNTNLGKEGSDVKKENVEKSVKEKLDTNYKLLPKSYAQFGAKVMSVSVDDNGSKDLTDGDSDSLEIFAPLELRQEKDGLKRVIHNNSNMIVLNINSNDNNNNKLKIHENSKKSNKKFPRIRNNNRINNRNQRIVGIRNKYSKRYPKLQNNHKRIITKYPKYSENNYKTSNKFPIFMDINKRNDFIDINYGQNKQNNYMPYEQIQSPSETGLAKESQHFMQMIATQNTALDRSYNTRRLISRQRNNRPLIRKKVKNNDGVKSSQMYKNVNYVKNAENIPNEESIHREDVNNIEWKLTSKPKFLLRAKLRNIHKLAEDTVSTNRWWTFEQPNYCLDPIFVVNDCQNKIFTKRWSYNVNDERCYFYEDYCSHIRLNSFVSSEECFQNCWRITKTKTKIEELDQKFDN